MATRFSATSPSVRDIVAQYEGVMSPAEKERLSNILWKLGETISETARATTRAAPVSKAFLYRLGSDFRQEGLRHMPPLSPRYFRR